MQADISQFEQLQHRFTRQCDVSITNSAIAPELIEYDRTKQWVTLTDELINQANQASAAPPDLIETLLSSRNKYTDALTAGQQKINDLILGGTQIDDFDRGVLMQLSTETKADLQSLLTSALPTAAQTPVAAQPAAPQATAPTQQ